MKEMLFKMRLFRYQIIWTYNSIATLLGTFILKMVTNYQHVTYIYTRNDIIAGFIQLCKGLYLYEIRRKDDLSV